MRKAKLSTGRPVRRRFRVYGLRALRMKADESAASLADRIDVSESTVRSWENGLRKPSEQAVACLARALRVSPGALYGVKK